MLFLLEIFAAVRNFILRNLGKVYVCFSYLGMSLVSSKDTPTIFVPFVKVLDPRTAVKDADKMASDSVKKDLEALKKYQTATKDISDMLVSGKRERDGNVFVCMYVCIYLFMCDLRNGTQQSVCLHETLTSFHLK